MNVSWMINDNDSEYATQSHVHWAPRATGDDLRRGAVALACSRFSPKSRDASVRETDAPISCRTCAKEYERAQKRGSR